MTKNQINILKKNVLSIMEFQLVIDLTNFNLDEFDVLSDEMLKLLKLENTGFESLLTKCTAYFIFDSEHEMLNFVNRTSYEDIYLTDKYRTDLLIPLKYCLELHYCYLSTICDYISQMTDDYAIKEYEELFLT